MYKIYQRLAEQTRAVVLKLAGLLEEKKSRADLSVFFYLKLAGLNTLLVVLEILEDLLKYLIILVCEPSQGFKVLFEPRELKVCPYSFSRFVKVRQKIRFFSAAGAASIVAVSVITSLLVNLILGPSLPSFAATYTFSQSDWNSQTANTAVDPANRTGWTEYSSKSSSLATGTALAISLTASSTTKTTDADFGGASTSQTQVGADSVKLAVSSSGQFGSGADGAWTISSAKNINADTNGNGGRTCADGVSYNVTSLSTTTATLSGTPPAGCYAAGDKVMLINLQGDGTNLTNVGNYEFLTIQSVSGNTITFTGNKTKYYGSGASNDDLNMNWQQVSAGGYHTLAVKTDGTLWAWGNNSYGQLGLGDTTQRTSPVQVGTGTNWQSVSAGGYHTLAVKTDGTLWAWGNNSSGRLGLGDTTQRTSPVQVGTGTNWQSVSAGESHTLAIKTDGTLWAWGFNTFGQLGLGDWTQRTSPVQVGTGTNWQSVSAGNYDTLAIKTDGTLWGWGRNNQYQLGLGNTTNPNSPVQVGTGTNWQQVSIKTLSTLAIKTDGTLWAWGININGQLGLGDTTQRTSPVQVGTGTNWQSVSAGNYYTLAIKTDGTLWAWGNNSYGQLGLGDTTQRNSPVQVGTSIWQKVSAGGYDTGNRDTTIAIKTDGTLWAWGYNNNGQLGLGDTTQRTSPVRHDIQKVILQRIPQYTDVTIQSGGSLTANAWDGTKGGVLAFYANGTVDVQSGGSVTTTGIGYRGGSYSALPYQGESYNKRSNQYSASPNLGGGGLGDDGYDYSDGAGGGYGTAGQSGMIGQGGLTYGTPALSKIFMGSGGADIGWWAGYSGYSNGGGIIYVLASDISVGATGNITSNGNNAYYNGGGAGAGGSIYISGNTVSLNNNRVLVSGGTTTFAGGVGRIYLKSNIITGTTSPAAATSSLPTTYYTSGTFTSAAIDVGTTAAWGSLSWNATLNGQTLTMKARSSANADMSGATDWASCVNISSGATLSSGNCVTDGERYIQYQAALSTSDNTVTPSLDDVTIGYSYYPSDQYLVSSAYNTGEALNVMGTLVWSEDTSLPASTTVTVSLRTASSSAGLDSAPWFDFSNATANCSKAAGTATCSNTALNTVSSGALTDGTNDQWFQYKVTLTSSGADTPTVSEVSVNYVINAPPELQSVVASQNADGTVAVSYEVRDPDTDSGSPANQYKVTPSFAYSTDGGQGWTPITSGLSAEATSSKTVATSSWASYILNWAPGNLNLYSTSTRIRVTVNDNEAANNTASSSSADFTLDAKAPVAGAAPIIVRATTSPAQILLSVTDDSALEMKVGLASDLAGASWQAYASTTTLALATDPDTVYVQFRDTFGNTNPTIYSATTPETPSAFMIQDTTNMLLAPPEYRLFLAWKAAAVVPTFYRYLVFRSADGVTFSQLTQITDQPINYYGDNSMPADTLTYYRVALEDTSGNLSFSSTAIQAKANGAQDAGEGGGGTGTTPPAISGVAADYVYTTQATISWETDTLSDSRVEYITSSGGNFTAAPSQGLATMVNNLAGIGKHAVVVKNLAPGTTYYFQVKSTDAVGNTGVSKQGSDGYSFTTQAGAAISQVNAIPTSNTSAKVSWTTSQAAPSAVFYSLNSDLSGPASRSESASTTSHELALTGLTSGTRYYYFVQSDVAVDNNQGVFYSFTTPSDAVAPIISAVAAGSITDSSALISWLSSEPADSRLEYGTVSGVYPGPLVSAANLDTRHSLALTDLASSTVYYFRVSSSDASGNSATSSEFTFTTSEPLLTETQAEAREQAAKEQGIAEQKAATPAGGGALIIDKTDKTAPLITGITVSDLKSDSASLSWKTNEAADSFAEYGRNTTYGDGKGSRQQIISHRLEIYNLMPEETYHYRVSSADASGNLAVSADLTFTTPSLLAELKEQEKAVAEVEALSKNETKSKESLLISAAEKAMEIVSSVAGEVSLGTLQNTLFTQYDALERLAKAIPAPIFGGEPSVITTATTATVAWRTDKEANSLVAYAPESAYAISQSKNDPYSQVVGDPDASTRAHLVKISELKPDTVYHYQLRSRAKVGPTGKSLDFIFRTRTETLEITNYSIENVDAEKAVFKWITNLETDSQVKYIPYRGNNLAVDEVKLIQDKTPTTMHEIAVDTFEGGVIYQVEISGKDARGNVTSKTFSTFSTAHDNLPPVISAVQTDSAISPGKDVKIQTIISWTTNELSVGRVFYEKGISTAEALAEKTALESSFGKKHVVVITKFDPGAVYSFRIESEDSAGNRALSKTYTILTPRQKETVFQVILKNFESTFGWVQQLGL